MEYPKFWSRLRKIFVLIVILGLPIQVLALTPNDSLFPEQWYLTKIQAPVAWDTETGDSSLIIAVLDTGIDVDHPDFAKHVWQNSKEIAGNGKDDDGNGYVDDVNGWDFVSNDNNPSVDLSLTTDPDAVSHGTLVAGLIAAETNNGSGYAGVLWEAKIMTLRMLDEVGVGNEPDAAAAIDYAVENGAKVINMSFAGDNASLILTSAVKRAYEAGVVIVAALGNNAQNVNNIPVYPACLTGQSTDWVIGVTSTDDGDNGSDFSNYGVECADLSAPGEDIFGLGYQDITQGFADPYSGPWSGTSTASPLVAGAVGLLLIQYPDLTPDEVAIILKLSVDPIRSAPGGVGSFGVGRLNIARALEIGSAYSDGISVAEPEETENVEPAEPENEAIDKTISPDKSNEYYSFVALGAPFGARPDIQVVRADGTPYATFTAYTTNFTGGVHVELADFDGDAIPEVVASAGETGGPHIRIFKPFGAMVYEWFAYEKSSTHGVNIAVGDVNGDSTLEIVSAVGAGVSNDIVIWTERGQELSRFTVDGFAPQAPLAIEVADVDDDWDAEFVVWATSGEPRIAIYDNNGSLITSFLGDPVTTQGLGVTIGDVDLDDRDEIIVAVPTASGATIRAYNKIGALIRSFSIADGALSRGVEIQASDIDIDGEIDLTIAPRLTAGEIRVFSSSGNEIIIVGQKLITDNGAFLGAW